MLCWISIFGGLLIMMGQHDRSEALFYYFRLEDQVPEHHLLRLIDKHIGFEFVRQQLKDSYSEMGRPSIDPELLLRILLIGYLYGITSERKLVEELRMHLAWRWFTGLGFDQEIPHHSTFSKNRHGRFRSRSCLSSCLSRSCGSVWRWDWYRASMLVDGSFVEANAAKESRIPREQLAEAAQVHHTIASICGRWKSRTPWKRRCTSRIRYRPPIPIHLRDQRRHAGASRLLRQLSGRQSQLRDRGSAGHGSAHSQETVAAQDMLTRSAAWQGREPESVAAETTYGNGEFLQWLADRSITPYMRTRDSIHRKRSPFFGPERFTYEAEQDRYICPAGQPLNYGGQSHRNHAWTYIGTRKRCGPCALRPQCTSAAFPLPGDPSTRTSPATRPGFRGHPGVREGTTAEHQR